jgi:hypothetical protein
MIINTNELSVLFNKKTTPDKGETYTATKIRNLLRGVRGRMSNKDIDQVQKLLSQSVSKIIDDLEKLKKLKTKHNS